MDARCMVSAWKEAAASNNSNHSILYSVTSSSTQGKSSGVPPTSHPSISLITPTFCVFCVRPWPLISTCTFSHTHEGLAKVELAKVELAKVELAKIDQIKGGRSRIGQSRVRPLGLHSSSVHGLPNVLSIFVFPTSPFTHKVSAIAFGRYFNYIFWNKFPKHTFLIHRPWRHPGVCHQTKSLGRSRFQYSKDSRCTNKEVGSVESHGSCQTDVSVTFYFNKVWNQNTSSN